MTTTSQLLFTCSAMPDTLQRMTNTDLNMAAFAKAYLDRALILYRSFPNPIDHLQRKFGLVSQYSVSLWFVKCELEKYQMSCCDTSAVLTEFWFLKIRAIKSSPATYYKTLLRFSLKRTGYFRRIVKTCTYISDDVYPSRSGNIRSK